MIEIKNGRAAMKLSKSFYSEESLQAAALVLGRRAQVFLEKRKEHFQVVLRGGKKGTPGALSALAGEFVNEALSHQYRQSVIRFNRDLSQAVLGRAFAKGFPAMPADPLEELEPQIKIDRERDVADVLETARKIIA